MRGFRVLVAQDGLKGVEQAEYAKPDIILLDVMMPGIDGFETCRRLKANEATKTIPVIFITALSETESKMEGFEAGGVDYVTKPIDYHEVEARLKTHLTLRRLQQELEAEIEERKKVEAQLQKSMLELQTRNEELDAFAHTVAHDLKDPLGVITLGAEVLRTDYQDMTKEELDSSFATLSRNGKKSCRIVDELLMLATVKKERVRTHPLKMDIIVHDAWQRLPASPEKGRSQLHLPVEWPVAQGYAPWVEEVWVNFLSNALKYGGHPPIIRVGAEHLENGQIRFWIQDNGPGLPKLELAKVFAPFTRANRRVVRGHGLGLSIVRSIVEKLNGQVEVKSSGVRGEGCLFSFTLPAAAIETTETPEVTHEVAEAQV